LQPYSNPRASGKNDCAFGERGTGEMIVESESPDRLAFVRQLANRLNKLKF
jgi:hypothetical protein